MSRAGRAIETAFGDNGVQRNIPWVRFKVRNALKVIGDTDKDGPAPASVRSQMFQAAIIESCTAAQPPAACVDSNQRQQYQIELQHTESWRSAMVGFQDTESVPAPWRAGNESYELHPVCFHVDDRGRIEKATAPPGNSDNWIQIDLVPVG